MGFVSNISLPTDIPVSHKLSKNFDFKRGFNFQMMVRKIFAT